MTMTETRPADEVTGTTITLAGEIVRDFATLAVVADTDDQRPILTGIKLELAGSKLTALATDTYRLAIMTRNIVTDAPAFEAIIPAKWLVSVAKANKRPNIRAPWQSVAFTITERSISAEIVGAGTLTTQLIDGTYPSVAQLIPASNGIKECELLGFNPYFLADLPKLAPWCNDKVFGACARLTGLNDSARPFVIEGEGTKYVAMPIRVN